MISFLSYLRKVLVANHGLSGISLREHLLIFKEWRAMQMSGKAPLELEMPWITLIARNYLVTDLAKRNRQGTRVFEYGSGGSSMFFLNLASEVVSVEHDRAWFDLVKRRGEEKDVAGWSINLVEPELVTEAGIQQDASDPQAYTSDDKKFAGCTFIKYASFIDRYPLDYFDVVLVDGRSRPSCLVHGSPRVKKGGLLVLDNAERKYYLTGGAISPRKFVLVSSSYGALIGSPQFTRTNIYLRVA